MVTGAARGLGLGIAVALSGWGARIAVLDRDAREVDAACRELGAEATVPVHLDVQEPVNGRCGRASLPSHPPTCPRDDQSVTPEVS